MMDEPQAPQNGTPSGGYEVPPQYPAPPGARRPRAWGPGSAAAGTPPPWGAQGPPVMPPEDPAPSPWAPSSAPASASDRWGPAPATPLGGTALLDRPTVARRPVVVPVAPPPIGGAEPSWDWEHSHRLRNALLAAALILLLGSLIAAFVVFRDHGDAKEQSQQPSGQPSNGIVVQPATPAGGTSTTVQQIPPAAPIPPETVPAPPAEQPAVVPPATAPPTTQAPTPTTRATVPVIPPVTASPPASAPAVTTSTTKRG